ncbi:DNA recombinase [Bacillus thuringiensis]|uniref:recombinase family protein n=1 Tax=Bacillus thuringiensis TaxID=1428 RepID=UPI000BF9C3D4|nr:recombinase family protein [Bacillus thuringiensis]PFU39976.1 DNA recombinase [Bacillus thuringiensis]
MEQKKFGYIRVSSKEQNEGRQLEAMRKLGIHERDIFIDKQSGRTFQREQYQILKKMLRRGDILYIHSLDRFGRNKSAILEEWKDITQDIQAHIVVLDMPLLDTTKYKDSIGQLITDLVLQILSWLSEEERVKIKTRQREGIDLAKKQGKHLGRPKVEITDEFIQAYQEWKDRKITAVEAMKRSGMPNTTFYRMVKRYEQGDK